MEIKSIQDWQYQKKLLAQWRKHHPMFIHDINRVERHIDFLIQEYSKTLVKYRQTKSKRYLQDADRILQQATRDFKTIANYELLATLAKR